MGKTGFTAIMPNGERLDLYEGVNVDERIDFLTNELDFIKEVHSDERCPNFLSKYLDGYIADTEPLIEGFKSIKGLVDGYEEFNG